MVAAQMKTGLYFGKYVSFNIINEQFLSLLAALMPAGMWGSHNVCQDIIIMLKLPVDSSFQTLTVLKVKNEHHSKFSNLSNCSLQTGSPCELP